MEDRQSLSRIAPHKRILLLSHCLRPSQTCPGKFSKEGLHCPLDCSADCILKVFKEAAFKRGYKGICIAAGGSMALKFVKEYQPEGIVAVACAKELKAGIEGVREMSHGAKMPVIVVIPLLSDGCVDTEVDKEEVLQAINLGE